VIDRRSGRAPPGVFPDFVDDFNHRHGPGSPWPRAVLEEWVEGSPLAKVSFVAAG
jgi:hypothetical protein